MPSGAVVTFSLNLLSALVALLTSYYAYRFNRLVESPVLKAISVGFMLLGIGLAAEAATSFITGRVLVEAYASRVFDLVASFTYLTVQMVAYLVIAIGYARAAYGGQARQAGAAVLVVSGAVGLYGYALLSYFVALVLLAFVVFQGLLLRSREKSKFSGTVMLAFVLILLAHLVLLASVLTVGAGLFLVGVAVQFLGFLSLLIFVVRSEVVGPG